MPGADRDLFESHATRTVSSRGLDIFLITVLMSAVVFVYFLFFSHSRLLTKSMVCVDDVFFSMADMDMSHSLSSLPPLGEPPTVDLDLSINSNYSASPGESPSGNATVCSLNAGMLKIKSLCRHSSFYKM